MKRSIVRWRPPARRGGGAGLAAGGVAVGARAAGTFAIVLLAVVKSGGIKSGLSDVILEALGIR